MKKLCLLLGRICLSLIFVASAVGKLFSWNDTLLYMTTSFSRWMRGTPLPDPLGEGLSWASSYAVPLLAIATLLEGIGGLFILLGFNVRLGAILLMLFLIPVTIIIHPFWLESGSEKMLQMTMFMKNLSILGGVMILAAKCEGSEC